MQDETHRNYLGLHGRRPHARARGTSQDKARHAPVRERVEVQLDNTHYTLVEEERIVPLLKSTAENGNNRIDFSWSNTHIDKNTILFRPLEIRQRGKFRAIKKVDGRYEVNVINVAYPPVKTPWSGRSTRLKRAPSRYA